MPVEVILPKVDMDMESGTIEAWQVSEGDRVNKGDVIFEIGTNKAVMEVEAPATGVIGRISAKVGVPIPVGAPVAWIFLEGESIETVKAANDGVAAPVEKPVVASPRAVESAPPTAGKTAATASGVRATPLARRLARTSGVDIAAVQGSGPRGRIAEADVKRHLATLAMSTPSPIETKAPDASGQLVPFSSVRRIVAQRLGDSMRTAPHFYLSSQIEMTAALAVVKRLSHRHERMGAPKPSLTVFITRVAALVLRRHPLINASVEGEAARLHQRVDIGVAMERDGDIVVPVLRDADGMDMPALAREFARLRDGAQKRSLSPAELGGGTFTISNLGMYGVDSFTAIINPPQSAILAVGRTVDTPVGRDGQIVLRPIATFTLSSDHRIVDGVTAARFMADLREAMENPETLL